jgi:integrase
MFCRLLCYTGMRLGEALAIKIGAVDLERQSIYLPETKNGDARTVHLTPELVTELANHPRGLDRPASERLVRFHASGPFREKLKAAMKAAGLSFPRRQGGFHLFCHTYASWMHQVNGMDNFALARTGRWKDPRSAEGYLHTRTSAEARLADNLPVAPKRGQRVERKLRSV